MNLIWLELVEIIKMTKLNPIHPETRKTNYVKNKAPLTEAFGQIGVLHWRSKSCFIFFISDISPGYSSPQKADNPPQ